MIDLSWAFAIPTAVCGSALAWTLIARARPTSVESFRHRESEMERLLRGTFDQASVGIAHVARDGRFVRINDRYCEIVGYSREEILAGSSQQITRPDDLQADVRHQMAMLAGNADRHSAEKRYVRSDGDAVWVNLTVSLVRDEAGVPDFFMIVLEDITARKAAEARLRDREALLEGISNAVPGLVYAKDTSLRILYVNPKSAAVVGRPVHDIVGLTDDQWFPDLEQAKAVMANDRRVMDSGEAQRMEEIFTTSDGQTSYWISTKAPLRDVDGAVVGIVGVSSDITPQKEAEAELRASEARFRELADAMPSLVFTARSDGYMDYYNDRWYAYTGTPKGECGDQCWEPVVHPDDVQHWLASRHRAVTAGKADAIEFRLKEAATGEYRWHLGRAKPVRDAAGTITKWYGTCTDIHDLKVAQGRLNEALKTKELLLYEVNHRVKNSLQMVTSLMLIEASKIQDPEARAVMMTTRQKVATIAQLHQRLYTEGSHDSVDFVAFLRDLSEKLLRTSGSEDRLTIDVIGTACSLPMCTAGPLSMIANELATNALKHALPERGGRIAFDVERAESSVSLSVSDTGVGLPPGFDPAAATSVGMKVVTGLVQQLGGSLKVSAADGGTTFRVEVPIGQAA